MQTLQFEIRDRIARLTLNRPDRLNSFTAAMHAELREALALTAESAAGETDQAARVLLITGAGRAFCAGQDLAEHRDHPLDEAGVALSIERDYAPLVTGLRALRVPVVCAVNGPAAGAGANFALSCDLVVARESATFIQSFTRIGLIPDTGGTAFLPRLVGTARAFGLALLADPLPAKQAAEWGLIWRAIPDAEFEAEVEALLQRLAQAPTAALALTKQALYRSLTNTLEDQLLVERDLMVEASRTHDFSEGIRAFLEKRPAKFTGR